MEHRNLLGEPPATYLLPDTEADAAVAAGEAPEKIAARFPAYSAAWASLAERAFAQGDPVTAYAYARTGYHRGLDQLRRAGWKGHGPVPWEHEPNRGFLRALYMLGASAAAIGEDDEAERCGGARRRPAVTMRQGGAEAKRGEAVGGTRLPGVFPGNVKSQEPPAALAPVRGLPHGRPRGIPHARRRGCRGSVGR
jgi:hypothetical protein